MKAVLLLVAITLAFAAVSAQKNYATVCRPQSLPGQLPLQSEVLQFLEGFALGVGSGITNVTQCVSSATTTLSDFQNAYQDLKIGFTKLSLSHLQKGVQEVSTGLQDVATTFETCGIPTLVADIKRIVAEIKTGGVFEFVVKEVVNIFHHHKEVTGDFKNFIKYWEAKNFNLAGVSMGKLVVFLLQA